MKLKQGSIVKLSVVIHSFSKVNPYLKIGKSKSR